MSTTSSPLTVTTTSADPAASSSQSSSGGSFSPPSSTLYLLTFLATLFVLLFVSCAIVLRSFFIRRRFRQQVEEQIAAGLLPPEALNPRRDFGEKPKLWDVSIHPAALNEPWEYISPVSAKVIDDPLPSSDELDMPHSPTRYQRFTRRVLRRAPESPAPPNGAPPDTTDPLSFLNDADLQVAVMVAMPSPRKSRRTSREGIPDMVIGISQISVRTPDS